LNELTLGRVNIVTPAGIIRLRADAVELDNYEEAAPKSVAPPKAKAVRSKGKLHMMPPPEPAAPAPEVVKPAEPGRLRVLGAENGRGERPLYAEFQWSKIAGYFWDDAVVDQPPART
jgi:hypothetical protein